MSNRFVVVDSNNIIVNVIVWDGTTEWKPPPGCAAYKSDTGEIDETFETTETPAADNR